LNPDCDMGPPTGRKDVLLLDDWLDMMINKYVINKDMDNLHDDVRLKCAQLIYTIAYKEIVRQNASICIERGLLMEKIWNSNITLFSVAEDI